MSRTIILTPSGDIQGFNSGTPFPASPTTHFDKVDEYPTADDDTTYILHDLSNLPGTEYFDFIVPNIPSGHFITSVEGVLRVWSSANLTDILTHIFIGDANFVSVGESGGILIPQGWSTIIMPLVRTGGGEWAKDDFGGGVIGYLIAGGGSPDLRVSQFYVRVNLISHDQGSAESLAQRATGTSIAGCTARAQSLAPVAECAPLAPQASAVWLVPEIGDAE